MYKLVDTWWCCVSAHPVKPTSRSQAVESSLWSRCVYEFRCSWAHSQSPRWWRRSAGWGSGLRRAAPPNLAVGVPDSGLPGPGEQRHRGSICWYCWVIFSSQERLFLQDASGSQSFLLMTSYLKKTYTRTLITGLHLKVKTFNYSNC